MWICDFCKTICQPEYICIVNVMSIDFETFKMCARCAKKIPKVPNTKFYRPTKTWYRAQIHKIDVEIDKLRKKRNKIYHH